MNLYNLEEFKCHHCQQWFHPKHSPPYSLPCSHSLCSPCLQDKVDQQSRFVVCPFHKTRQPIDQIKINAHIQEALERLMKNCRQPHHKRQVSNPSSLQKELQRLIGLKWEDTQAFRELLQRIYTNEINRLIHLRSRIRQQVIGHSQTFQHWKSQLETGSNGFDLMQQGRNLQQRIKEFNTLDLQQMAGQIIEDPSLILQRNFSIYDLVKKERKTLKSSTNHNKSRMQSSLPSQYFIRPEKENEKYLNFMVKTVQSPEKVINSQLSNILCKQLSSFKLDESILPEDNSKNSKIVDHVRITSSITDEPTCNGQITLRQNQYSKCSLKSKPNEKREQKMSRFAELINSLKSQEELTYSPQISEQLLLSQPRQQQQINFLHQYPVQRKEQRNSMQIRKRNIIISEKENNKYIKKMEEVRTQEAFLNTCTSGTTIELFNFDLKEVDIKGYLERFNWNDIEVVKMVNTGLQDHQLNQLLNYLIKANIQSLVLPSNELQEISLDALINFTNINSHLKSVSLQKNNINTLQGNVRSKIGVLRRKGINLYI